MYIYLDIVADFACEMCGRCCRNDWQITLNEESYQRNKRLFQSTGQEKEFAQAFILLGDNRGLDEHAYIAKQANGSCCFLAEENYCLLHRKAGHSHLDAVCQLFPRYPISTARGQELTLSFSCPAVLKLASRKTPLAVIRSEKRPMEIIEGQFVAHVYPQQQRANNPLRYYFELEQHFIDIMQWRGLTIKDRLQTLNKTVEFINGEAMDHPSLGSKLTAVFNKNYEYFDTKPVQLGAMDNSGEVLLENFFVNLIFKKVPYLYGLSGAMQFFKKAAEHIEQKLAATDEQGNLAAIAEGIMDIEFQYGHNRKTLLQNVK